MDTNVEISNTAPLWWELQNIPTEVVRELRRRSNSNNIGFDIPNPLTNVTYNFDQIYKNGSYGYKGPMTPWVRVFSNSTGKSINGMVPRSDYLDKYYVPVDYEGFILKGGDGFFDAFGYDAVLGFQQTDAIIGYQANGKPHFIDGLYRTQTSYLTRQKASFPQNNNTPSVLPPPGVTKVSVKQSKEFLTYATVSFKCYGLAQLEYLTPFFLTAGINVFIEFGWNLFNQKSLLDLNNYAECWEVIEKPQTALDRANKSYGNYGCVSGIITKYSFNTSDGFVYDCTMELTSRQGMFAGMRTDNNAKISNSSVPDNKDEPNSVEFLDLRTFFKLYLPSINQVLEENQKSDDKTNNSRANFLNYIIDKINVIDTSKQEKDSKAAQQQLENSKKNIKTILSTVSNANNTPNSNTTLFYGGKAEDRAFIGRLESVYKLKKNIGGGPVIKYNTSKIKPGNVGEYIQASDADEQTDFDAKDGSNEVWMQLDFVFELANLFMSNSKTKQFYLDIDDVIISAHPNLISCDKNVLIPNPVSPKINKGTRAVVRQNMKSGGFLRGNNVSPDTNPFLKQLQDITVERNTELEKKLKFAKDNGTLPEFYKNLSVDEGYYLACEAARKAFKTTGRIRDNLDMIINYLHYHSINNNKPESAAFPFASEFKVEKPEKNLSSIYKKYYYGKLKHIYISKTKLIEIVKSEDTKNYKQFINAILNTINSATENFWKFDIVEGRDKNGRSTLSIVDKNMSNFDAMQQIYTFELGSTNNVVKSIDFNVSLTNEQAINVMFGGQNSAIAGLKDKFTQSIKSAETQQQLDATLNDLSKIPFIKFVDRMDIFQLGLLAKNQAEEIKQKSANPPTVSTVPGTTSGIQDNNSAIESLQKYGKQDNLICMCVRQVPSQYAKELDLAISTTNTTPAASIRWDLPGGAQRAAAAGAISNALATLKELPKNYKFLCLPPELKGKLLQMLDDNDYRHNASKYSGVADNFTVTIKFDGIFSFRNLQVFAINNLPKPYVPGNVIFQVLEVDHEISAGKWETVVNALVRCVGSSQLEYIKV